MSGSVADNIDGQSGVVAAVATGIELLSSDPGSPTTGQVWFNTTASRLKYYNGTATRTVTDS
jgi:hypothetical protein